MHLLTLQIRSESGQWVVRTAHAPIMRHYARRRISIDQLRHYYAQVHAKRPIEKLRAGISDNRVSASS